jgi:hypothetical protein
LDEIKVGARSDCRTIADAGGAFGGSRPGIGRETSGR